MNNNTSKQFDTIIKLCKDIFFNKMKDYGASWRVMRASSITDQILIKANRIKHIQEAKIKKINENEDSEFIGIVNYSIIGLIQLEYYNKLDKKNDLESIMELYNSYIEKAKRLMFDKNHDYDEIWRKMRVSSFTDIILMKLNRVKQIEDNDGTTVISEGIDANYFDIINYAIFALIKINKKQL